eukprot:c23543_g1_i2 orf=833-1900(-)
MSVSNLNKHHVMLEMWLNPSKAVSGGKAPKKENHLRNLLVLAVLGICGISLCLTSMGHSNLVWKSSTAVPQQSLMEATCHKDFLVDGLHHHFPFPRTYDRGECACTAVHYFVILSMQRSGSGWFETLLNNHPNISSHGEIFSVKQRRANFSIIMKTLDSVYNLEWLSSAAKNGCTSAVGFKWMLNQGVMEYNKEVAAYFKKKGVSVIFLLRWNTLRRLVSILANAYDRDAKQLNGTHKSHVHSKEEAETLAAYKPTINVAFLPENLKRVEEITKDALQFFNGTRHKIVYYEDLVNDQRTLAEVQLFLGVPRQNLESQQVKIHTKPLSTQVQNWEAVYKRIKGTVFEVLELKDYKE